MLKKHVCDFELSARAVLQVSRMYATFHMNVLSNPAKGQQILNSLTDNTNRNRKRLQHMDGLDKTGIMDDTVLFDDDTAVIVISLELGSLGKILQCNDSVASLFGRARSDLEGQNISVIVPNPFAEVHDGFLKMYKETGHERVVNRVRRLFGLHKSGYVFPVQLLVKQVSGGLDETKFMGILIPLSVPTTEHYLMVDSATGTILRSTANLSSIVDISLNEMVDGRAHIHKLVPDFEVAGMCADEMQPDDGDIGDGNSPGVNVRTIATSPPTPLLSSRQASPTKLNRRMSYAFRPARFNRASYEHRASLDSGVSLVPASPGNLVSALSHHTSSNSHAYRSKQGGSALISKGLLSTTCQVYVQRLTSHVVTVDVVRVVEKFKRSQNLPENMLSPRPDQRRASGSVAVHMSPPKSKPKKKTTFDSTPELFAIEESSDDEHHGGVEYIMGEVEQSADDDPAAGGGNSEPVPLAEEQYPVMMSPKRQRANMLLSALQPTIASIAPQGRSAVVEPADHTSEPSRSLQPVLVSPGSASSDGAPQDQQVNMAALGAGARRPSRSRRAVVTTTRKTLAEAREKLAEFMSNSDQQSDQGTERTL